MRSIERIEERADKRFKSQQFYTPIHYYTCNQFYRVINEGLRNIQFEDQGEFLTKEMEFIGALIKSLSALPNHVGMVYRGINKLRFSSHQKVGDLFYWKGFTSTSLKASVGEQFGKNGTIFHINSISGKNVSLFSIYEEEEEVIFLPFTYFIVEEIKNC